jgi:hypothetical protein
MSADSVRRSSHSSSRGRYGSSSSSRSVAETANAATAATAAAQQWRNAEVPSAVDSGSAAAAMAPVAAQASAAAAAQDYPVKALEFEHVDGHIAAAAASTSTAGFISGYATHSAGGTLQCDALQCDAMNGYVDGYSNSYAAQQVLLLV